MKEETHWVIKRNGVCKTQSDARSDKFWVDNVWEPHYKQRPAWPVYSFLLFPPSMDHYLPWLPPNCAPTSEASLRPGPVISFKGQGALSESSSWLLSSHRWAYRSVTGMQCKESKSPRSGKYPLPRIRNILCSCWRDRRVSSAQIFLDVWTGKPSGRTPSSPCLFTGCWWPSNLHVTQKCAGKTSVEAS